jgi:hypothetical protein
VSWCRFVPGFSRHPKRIKSGPISSWLWICSVDYCTEHLTDGWIDESAVPYLCASITGSALKRAIENLVSIGSWERFAGGFRVHDYLRHNLSKTQVEQDREQARTRYRNWRSQQADNGTGQNADPTPLATPFDPPPTPLATPKQQRTNRSYGRSVGRVVEKPTTSKTDLSHDNGPEPTPEQMQEHQAKKRAALEMLHRANLTPPPDVSL